MAVHHPLVFPVPCTESAVRPARHRVVATVRAWDIRLPEDVLDAIELVTGELIANAVQHAALGPISVGLRQDGDALVVEVEDAAKTMPRTNPLDPDAESGRGLQLVSALADRHGADLTETGKRCWAQFRLPAGAGSGGEDQRNNRWERPVCAGTSSAFGTVRLARTG
ncbi:ATP-binding protein [Streptomyces sp. NPDC049910]|uniref:ATP-binding protein n=1 Tax=Streptomyces sp. NPDC049910 TaxID=3155278 RepID=UPI0034157921